MLKRLNDDIFKEIEAEENDIRLLGILCNWCSYAGADLAGTSRFQYSTSIRIVRVMCSGRVDPIFLLKGFKYKIDGILVGGCHFGDCHYIDGNYHAAQKIEYTIRILKYLGIDKRRLKLVWVSAAEGKRFSKIVNEFDEEIRSLGKLNLSEIQLERLERLIEVISDFKFKWLIGKKLPITVKGNVYNNIIPVEKYTELLDEIVESEFLRKRILATIDGESHSAIEIAEKLNIESAEVMKNLIALMNNHKVVMEIKHHDAYFIKEEA